MNHHGTQDDTESLSISGSSFHDEYKDNAEAQSQALDMQHRAKLLLAELGQFQQYLQDNKMERSICLSSFKSDIQSELKQLEKVNCIYTKIDVLSDQKQISATQTTDEKILHTIRSSNFPFFEHMVRICPSKSNQSPEYIFQDYTIVLP